MKPRDQWAIGDIITGPVNRFSNTICYVVILRDPPNDYCTYFDALILVQGGGFTGRSETAFIGTDDYHSTLTEPQMALLHLEAYEALYHQLEATLLSPSPHETA